MWIPNKRRNLSPFLKQAKSLLLVLSVALLVANLYVLSSTLNHARSYSEQQNQATWFLFQLTKEFSELTSITPFVAQSAELNQTMLLKYELTWSRFDLLIANKEADTFITLPGAKDYFVGLFNQFKVLEPRINAIANKQNAEDVAQELDQLYQSMIQYVNINFRVKSPLYQAQMEQARQLNYIQLALLILLILCGVLTIYILHKESLYHKEQSLTDSLTDSCNRLAMFQDLTQYVDQSQPFTLFLLDLNGFKEINDQYGHQVGDQVLISFAARLRQINGSCYRIGGDEFALLIDDPTYTDYQLVIEHIKQLINQPISTSHDVMINAATSIGFASYPTDSDDINELLLIADNNMYREKHALRKVSG